MAAGYGFSAVVLNNGTVKTWGTNGRGNLGLGDTTNRLTPTLVQGLANVKAVSAGWGHVLALRTDGTVCSWGYNQDGQLGLGLEDTTDRYRPTVISGLAGVCAVAAGAWHSVALINNGSVRTWGYNHEGELGQGDTLTRRVPMLLPGLTGVRAVAAGRNHSAAVLQTGVLTTWGANPDGRLGLGDTATRLTPTPVPGLPSIGAVTCGWYHNAVLSVWAAAQSLGGGWLWLDWFGCFRELGGGWIYHTELGSLYCLGGAPATGIWLWSPRFGSVWTTETLYPSLWRAAPAGWLWYYRGTGNGAIACFYDFRLHRAVWL